MASVGECMREQGPCVAVVAGVALLAVGIISMLVCGILGRMGKLPMAPMGARVMTAIPATIIAAMVGFGGMVVCNQCR